MYLVKKTTHFVVPQSVTCIKYPWDVQHGLKKARCWLTIRSACVEHEHSLLQHSHLHQWLILPGVKLGRRSTFSQTRQVRAHSFSPPSFHSFYPWLGLRMLWDHFFFTPSTLSTQMNLLCSGNIQHSSSDAEGGGGPPSEELEPGYCGVLAHTCEMQWVGSTRGACQGETYRGPSGVPTRLVK